MHFRITETEGDKDPRGLGPFLQSSLGDMSQQPSSLKRTDHSGLLPPTPALVCHARGRDTEGSPRLTGPVQEGRLG